MRISKTARRKMKYAISDALNRVVPTADELRKARNKRKKIVVKGVASTPQTLAVTAEYHALALLNPKKHPAARRKRLGWKHAAGTKRSWYYRSYALAHKKDFPVEGKNPNNPMWKRNQVILKDAVMATNYQSPMGYPSYWAGREEEQRAALNKLAKGA